jgi:hypothetical protein
MSESQAVEQAAAMADRYNRIFLRTLRALRDLRRYAPAVIVQNAGQVNVRGQQVNVAGGHAVLLWLGEHAPRLYLLEGDDLKQGWNTTTNSKAVLYDTMGEPLRDGGGGHPRPGQVLPAGLGCLRPPRTLCQPLLTSFLAYGARRWPRARR